MGLDAVDRRVVGGVSEAPDPFERLCARRNIACALTDRALVVRRLYGAPSVWGAARPGDALDAIVPELARSRAAIEAHAGDEPLVLDWIHRVVDGRERIYEPSVQATDDGLAVWLVDVTAAAGLRHTLAETRDALTDSRARFAARNAELTLIMRAIGHDLRAPLKTLASFLDNAGGAGGAVLIGAARDMALELAGLVDAIVEHGRVHERPIRPRETTLAAVLRRVADLHAIEIADREAIIELAADVALRVDPDLLSGALGAVVDNALRYARPGGPPRIRFEGREQGDRIVLAIEDDGPGVAADDRLAAVQPLVRLDAGRAAPGHGLGLATAARACAHLGGTLRLTAPVHLGGCRVEIELPTEPRAFDG